MSIFNERLQIIRMKKGLTQKETAVALGMVERAYRSYEIGEREPNIEKITAIARLFNVSLDYLFGLTDEQQK